ncbi:unnamed protein product [Mycena citricolor]|uniref:Fungal-type protein kinase domain-containing protein n=1 Tax=Mycena citricolor TaxID=2018698 RepID=A0AAD2HHU2_9AGAR|nr:unnamed protein product [Mycena citricolor]
MSTSSSAPAPVLVITTSDPTPYRDSSHASESLDTNVQAVQDSIMRELEGHFYEDPYFHRRLAKKAKEAHPQFENAANEWLNDANRSGYRDGKWTAVANEMGPGKLEKKLYDPLHKLLDAIMVQFGNKESPSATAGYHGTKRQVRETWRTRLHHHNPDGVKIVLDGETKSIRIKSAPDLAVLVAGPSATKDAEIGEMIDYTQAGLAIEVKRDEGFTKAIQCQLAVYAREIFIAQDNRRFVLIPLLTGKTMRIVQFDRCGVHYSPAFDYHEEPLLFIKLVYLLTSHNEEWMGYDTRILWQGGKRVMEIPDACVRTDVGPGWNETARKLSFDILDENGNPGPDVKPSFARRTIRSRGTVCWAVRDVKTNKQYLVKIAWPASGRVLEPDMLKQVSGVKGMGQMYAYVEPTLEATAFDLRLMTAKQREDTGILNRFHVLLVLEFYGSTLNTAETAVQLLRAIRNIVKGHRESVLDKGVMHRDISFHNILLSSIEAHGEAVLIDLDTAKLLDHLLEMIDVAGDFRRGTRAFQSFRVLVHHDLAIHDHMDDLESIFYVLLWRDQLPAPLGHEKRTLITGTFSPIIRFMDSATQTILMNLVEAHQELFAARIAVIDNTVRLKTLGRSRPGIAVLQEPFKNAVSDYQAFLAPLDVAIEALEGLPENPVQPGLGTGPPTTTSSSKRPLQGASSTPTKKRRLEQDRKAAAIAPEHGVRILSLSVGVAQEVEEGLAHDTDEHEDEETSEEDDDEDYKDNSMGIKGRRRAGPDSRRYPFMSNSARAPPPNLDTTETAERLTVAATGSNPYPYNDSSHASEPLDTNVQAVQGSIMRELEGHFYEDPYFHRRLAKKVKEAHPQFENAANEWLDDANRSGYRDGKWTAVANETGRGKLEKKLYDPLHKLLDAIMVQFGNKESPSATAGCHGTKRQVRETWRTRLHHHNPDGVKIVLDGETKSIRIKSAPDLAVLVAGPSATKDAEIGEMIDYTQAGLAIEVKCDEGFTKAVQCQLAVYAREIFIAQDNRPFVLIPLLTEKTMRIVQFDRCGVHYSPAFDYHEEPLLLIKLVAFLTSHNEEWMGYDTRIFWQGGKRVMDIPNARVRIARASGWNETVEKLCFVVLDEHDNPRAEAKPTFARRTIRSRGTTCWKVQHSTTKKKYLVKIAWSTSGRVPESDMLKRVSGVRGMGQMYAYVEPTSEETVFDTRLLKAREQAKAEPLNRFPSFLVLELYGSTLNAAATAIQLLRAIKCIVEGHQRCLVDKEVMHRDISYNNILLSPIEEHGEAVLIDLDMAKFIDHLKQMIGGTRAFQSVRVLSHPALGIHDQMDDLESIFYVLLWVLCCLDAKGGEITNAPFLKWFDATLSRDTLGDQKIAVLTTYFRHPITRFTDPATVAILGALIRAHQLLFRTRLAVIDNTVAQARGEGAADFPVLQTNYS